MSIKVMSSAQEFLEDNMHPTKIIAAYRRALDDIEEFLNQYARTIDPTDDAEMKKMVQSSLGTKFIRFKIFKKFKKKLNDYLKPLDGSGL